MKTREALKKTGMIHVGGMDGFAHVVNKVLVYSADTGMHNAGDPVPLDNILDRNFWRSHHPEKDCICGCRKPVISKVHAVISKVHAERLIKACDKLIMEYASDPEGKAHHDAEECPFCVVCTDTTGDRACEKCPWNLFKTKTQNDHLACVDSNYESVPNKDRLERLVGWKEKLQKGEYEEDK